ncbi:MAG: hypothetical protein R3F59_31840 [Myxococcota bacterium]
MNRRWLAAPLAVVLLGVAWVALRPEAPDAPEAGETPAAPVPPPVAATAPAPRPRTLLPRPVPLPAAAPEPEPEAADDASLAADPALDPAEAGPIVAAADLPEVLPRVFDEELRGALEGCVEGTAPPEGFDGKLLLDLQLDTAGLREAAIDGWAGAPDGLVDCVADAVWGALWPRMDQGETGVTYPVVVTMDPSG